MLAAQGTRPLAHLDGGPQEQDATQGQHGQVEPGIERPASQNGFALIPQHAAALVQPEGWPKKEDAHQE